MRTLCVARPTATMSILPSPFKSIAARSSAATPLLSITCFSHFIPTVESDSSFFPCLPAGEIEFELIYIHARPDLGIERIARADDQFIDAVAVEVGEPD